MRLEGFDYERLIKKSSLNNRRLAEVDRCIGPVRHKGPMLKRDAEFMLAGKGRPVKISMPGPMTVVNSTANERYRDEAAIAMDVAATLNVEARQLDAIGVAVIEFDELVFSRYPNKVKEWGITALGRCLEAGSRAARPLPFKIRDVRM